MSQLGLGMSDLDQGARRSRGPRGVVVALVALLVVGALLAGVVLLAGRLLGGTPDDYPGPGTGEVTVEIAQGATLTEMGDVLAGADVVMTAAAFVDAAKANPDAVQIQPGTYVLRQQMSGSQAVLALLDPASRVTERVTVPEGLRVSKTVALLAKKTHLTAKELRSALAAPETLGLPDYADDNPEGFLFPATYTLEPATTAEEQLVAMVDRFDEAASSVDLDERAADVGLTPYEVVIVASLIQAEGRPDDFDKVARVIYNRLDLGMRLQLDATVNYALGRSDLTLSKDDLAVDSPYNTYRVTGLPPGPINSPGEAALEAALAPAKGPWLYYVTVDPVSGRTEFTDSYAEFLRFKAEFQATQ